GRRRHLTDEPLQDQLGPFYRVRFVECGVGSQHARQAEDPTATLGERFGRFAVTRDTVNGSHRGDGPEVWRVHERLQRRAIRPNHFIDVAVDLFDHALSDFWQELGIGLGTLRYRV